MCLSILALCLLYIYTEFSKSREECVYLLCTVTHFANFFFFFLLQQHFRSKIVPWRWFNVLLVDCRNRRRSKEVKKSWVLPWIAWLVFRSGFAEVLISTEKIKPKLLFTFRSVPISLWGNQSAPINTLYTFAPTPFSESLSLSLSLSLFITNNSISSIKRHLWS